jgi:hypothetical protein
MGSNTNEDVQGMVGRLVSDEDLKRRFAGAAVRIGQFAIPRFGRADQKPVNSCIDLLIG